MQTLPQKEGKERYKRDLKYEWPCLGSEVDEDQAVHSGPR